MTNDWKDQLRLLSSQWRKTAAQTHQAQETMPDPLLRGHIQGVSDGLRIAAEDVDKLLAEPNGKRSEYGFKPNRS